MRTVASSRQRLTQGKVCRLKLTADNLCSRQLLQRDKGAVCEKRHVAFLRMDQAVPCVEEDEHSGVRSMVLCGDRNTPFWHSEGAWILSRRFISTHARVVVMEDSDLCSHVWNRTECICRTSSAATIDLFQLFFTYACCCTFHSTPRLPTVYCKE